MPETATPDKLTAEQLLHVLRAMLLGYVRAGTPVSWVQSLVVVLARDRLSRSELNEVGYRLAEHMTARGHELTLVSLWQCAGALHLSRALYPALCDLSSDTDMSQAWKSIVQDAAFWGELGKEAP